MDRFKMTIPGRPEYIQTAKLAVSSIASIGGFDYDTLEDIRIAVGEACKCITCHNQVYYSATYELSAVMGEQALTIKVKDGSPGHQIPKGAELCRDCPREGDLAVEIIRSIMDDMEIERNDEGMTSIIMTKSRG